MSESSAKLVQVFQHMENLDENQILSEMKGELLEEFVYSIDIQGRQVTNLSYAGVKEAVRRRGKYEILDVHVEEDKYQFRALVRVRDLIRQVDMLGASTCEKSKPFSYTLALNKAERNAYSKLIPAKLLAGMVKEFLERRKARSITIPPGPGGILPQSEVLVPVSQSPGVSWKVPITKDQATPEQIQQGVRQYPLLKDTRSFGMLNTLMDQASIVPENPIPANTALVDGFLIRKIVEPMKAKHGLETEIRIDKDGMLLAILIRGQLGEQQIKEIVSGARWAFERAMEPKGVPGDQRQALDRSHVGGPLR